MSESERVNPGYAMGQLALALRTGKDHPDQTIRAKAGKKANSWMRTLEGMISGLLSVGSRTPVKEVPAWATLEVLRGGFASGQLLAGGEWESHELELLRRLELDPSLRDRSLINGYYISETGFAELCDLLATGCYRVSLPEEGALLTVAWLANQGASEEARELLDILLPYFSRLRFYPVPAKSPLPQGDRVYLEEAGKIMSRLEAMSESPRFLAMREAVLVWNLWEDRAVALFQETVVQGWPCQEYPEDWMPRARHLVEEHARLRQQHTRCQSKLFARRLLESLQKCLVGRAKLSGRDVGMIRFILNAITAKRGAPGSEKLQRLRDEQREQATRPTSAQFGPVVAARLRTLEPDGGIPTMDGLLNGLDEQEAQRFDLPVQHPIPDSFAPLLRRCRMAPLEQQIQDHVVSSNEVLATVLPQLSAQVQAAEFADENLGRLFMALYQAFRKRRSLLLLNLEHQVKLWELPWVQATRSYRRGDKGTQDAARELLQRVLRLSLRQWPQVIIPNKLVQELRALSKLAGLALPLVDEIAADIFMGEFSEKFLRAAQTAGAMLGDSLYARYYGIAYEGLKTMEVVRPARGTPSCPAFARLCRLRAGLSATSAQRWGAVAENGMVIEQMQILTTHNLAVLFAELDLEVEDEMPRRCFTWVCETQQRKVDGWHTRLILRKNSAYAWRQMVFFVSRMAPTRQAAFLNWATDHLAQQGEVFRTLFAGVLLRLIRAAEGAVPGGDDAPFLGWVRAETPVPA